MTEETRSTAEDATLSDAELAELQRKGVEHGLGPLDVRDLFGHLAGVAAELNTFRSYAQATPLEAPDPTDVEGLKRRLSLWRAGARDANARARSLGTQVKTLTAERAALSRFKTYVHERCDAAGVPTHPDGQHSKAGCRIGDRLDALVGERNALRERVQTLAAQLAAMAQREEALRTQLPEKYRRKRLPATLLERLNLDEASPLKGLIITQTNPKATGSAKKAAAWGCSGLLKDTSLLNALESSLSDGALYNYVDRATKVPDVEGMVRLLCAYWGAVQDTFPKAWAKPMDESRLFHGASVVALGFLMDAVCDRLQLHFSLAEPTRAQFAAELAHVSTECRWTEGKWDISRTLQRRWDDIQNTGKDRTLLSDHLRNLYLLKAGGRAPVGQE